MHVQIDDRCVLRYRTSLLNLSSTRLAGCVETEEGILSDSARVYPPSWCSVLNRPGTFSLVASPSYS